MRLTIAAILLATGCAYADGEFIGETVDTAYLATWETIPPLTSRVELCTDDPQVVEAVVRWQQSVGDRVTLGCTSVRAVRTRVGTTPPKSRAVASYSTGEIIFRPDSDDYRIAMHEIGHWLGLGHDDYSTFMVSAGQADYLIPCVDTRTAAKVGGLETCTAYYEELRRQRESDTGGN